ncbi:MAG: hypothetical protein JHC93_08280, partial [Parachlamydiales bacterium]|nr:hypothetical protein [Parachlamydiales bacterium]
MPRDSKPKKYNNKSFKQKDRFEEESDPKLENRPPVNSRGPKPGSDRPAGGFNDRPKKTYPDRDSSPRRKKPESDTPFGSSKPDFDMRSSRQGFYTAPKENPYAPKRSFGGPKSDGTRGGFNSDRPRKPRSEASFERKSYGSDSKPGYKGNSDRPRTPRGEGSFERKSYGSDSKPGYKGGFNSDRPRTPRGEGSSERKSYGSDSKPGYKGGFNSDRPRTPRGE